MTNFAQSFDAQEWAKAFVQYVKENPAIATDEGAMTAWFASAIMAGYDEYPRAAGRMSLDKEAAKRG